MLKIFLWTEKNCCGSKRGTDLELMLEDEDRAVNGTSQNFTMPRDKMAPTNALRIFAK